MNCLKCEAPLKKNRKYCNATCQMAFQYDTLIEKWKSGEWNGIQPKTTFSSQAVRRYLIEKYGNKCARCGWNEMNPYTKKVPLQVEHIDGDYKNGKEENLILLCPNCHTLTPTWGARNKGKGRPR